MRKTEEVFFWVCDGKEIRLYRFLTAMSDQMARSCESGKRGCAD